MNLGSSGPQGMPFEAAARCVCIFTGVLRQQQIILWVMQCGAGQEAAEWLGSRAFERFQAGALKVR